MFRVRHLEALRPTVLLHHRHLGAEAADQVLVEVAHHPVRHGIRVQVDACEVLADLVEQARLVEADDGIGEVELFEDQARVVREPRHVVLKVLAGLGAAQRGERVAGGVVERVAGDLAQDQVQIDAAVPMRLVGRRDICLLYTSPSPRDRTRSRMPSSA